MDEHARCQGNTDGIVEECPEQILADIREGCPAQSDGGGYVGQTALHQNHIRRVDGDIRTGTDGDADIRPGKGRGIVDAVAHHSHLAFRSQGADHGLLAVRQYGGDHFVHTRLTGDSPGGFFIIPRQHDHPDAHVLHLADRPGAVFLDHVRHGDDTEQTVAAGEEQRCLSGFGESTGGILDGGGDRYLFANEGGISSPQDLSVQSGRQTTAGEDGEVRHVMGDNASLACFLQDCPGEGMLAFCFQGSGGGEKFIFAHAVSGEDIRYPGFTGGDGAGLIQHHDLGASRGLQRGGGLEENAVFGTYAVAHHNGYGRGQSQSAGTADDEDGYAPCQSESHGFADQKPYDGSHGGNTDHHRYEDAGYGIGNFGDGGFGGRRIADHLNDVGEGSVLAHSGGLARKKSGLIDGAGGYSVPYGFVGGNALARQGGFVDGALTVQDYAVHGNALSGTNDEYITPRNVRNAYTHFDAVPDYGGGLGCQIHQSLEGIGGLAFGASLQHLAYGDQRQNHSRRFKIELVQIVHRQLGIPLHLGVRHSEQRVRAVSEGGGGAQRHQRIHIRGSVEQAAEAAYEEFLIDDHHDGGEEQLAQPDGHGICRQSGRQRPSPHGVSHRDIHQHGQKRKGENQTSLERRRFRIGDIVGGG